MSRRLLALFFAAHALAGASASASPLFELAGGVNGTAGFNGRTVGASAASTYFNPALLPSSSQEFSVGLYFLSDEIGMTLDGRPGGDVPLSVGERTFRDPNTGAPISNDTVPTDWLQNGCRPPQCSTNGFAPRPRQGMGSSGNTRGYATLGLVSRLIDPWLVVGVAAFVPLGDFTDMRSFYNDEHEALFTNSLHHEMYADRLTATSLAFGAGSQLTKQFSIGMSFTLSLANAVNSQTYVRDPADYSKLQLNNDVGVKTAVAPHFGVLYTPVKPWRIGATLHTEQKLSLSTAIRATLPDGSESSTMLSEVHHFVPWILGLSSSVDVHESARTTVTLAGTIAYEAWSNYLDRHGQKPGDFDPSLAWKDTVTGALGVRVNHAALRTYLDLAIRPSPVPPQTGRTNYVDNDRVGLTVGGDYDFRLGGLHFRPGLGASGQLLMRRYQAKDDALIRDELPDNTVDRNLDPVPAARGLQTNNPGWPGFASEGFVWSANVWLTLIYGETK
jgi:hypothetical protein